MQVSEKEECAQSVYREENEMIIRRVV